MNLRQYLGIMFFATILCWVAFWVVIGNIDPFESGATGFVFFYSSGFLALLGTLSVVLFGLYYLFSKGALPLFVYVQKSFYFSFLLTGTVLVLLYLRAQDLLTMWNLITVFIICLLFMAFVVSLSSTKRRQT